MPNSQDVSAARSEVMYTDPGLRLRREPGRIHGPHIFVLNWRT
jgi:hypothetical protein